ncbi:ATP synthase subunit beta mitochondrial, partial [Bienertia sinuspersici]
VLVKLCLLWNLLTTLPKLRCESKCSRVYGQINEPLGARAHVDLIRLTVAEQFCNARDKMSFSLTTF